MANSGKFDAEVLKVFIKQNPFFIAMFDRKMNYLAYSERWVDDYLLRDKRILGKCHYEIFPEITEKWKEYHQRGLKGEILSETSDEFVRHDGKVQYLRWVIKPWIDENDEVGGIYIFTEDITEFKIQEKKLIKTNEDLEQFTHFAAHDLREPCRRIYSRLDLFLEKLKILPGGVIKEVEILKSEALRLLEIIENFRQLTNIREFSQAKKPVDLSEVLKNVLKGELGDKAESFSKIEKTEEIEAFPELVELLFKNLVQNAITHGVLSDQEKLVFKKLLKNGNEYFTISNYLKTDDVKNIKLDRIFRPFVKGKSSVKGTGLGLAICKRIVERHDGDIFAFVENNQFTVALSLRPGWEECSKIQ